jgi:hypothetical protein
MSFSSPSHRICLRKSRRPLLPGKRSLDTEKARTQQPRPGLSFNRNDSCGSVDRRQNRGHLGVFQREVPKLVVVTADEIVLDPE